MAGQFTIRISPAELARFRHKLTLLSRETGKDAGTVMRMTMQSLVGTMSSWTPPRDQKKGEAVIEKDLRRLVSTKKYDEVKGQYRKAEELGLLSLLGFKWEPGAIVWARQLTKQMGTKEGAFSYILDEGAKALPAHHQRNRRPSDGRVVQNRGQFYGTVIGMQKYTDVLLMSNADFYKYMRTVFKRVGRLKGGWNKAAEVFRVRVAPWVWRHGTKEGSAVDRIKPNGTGYLEATNAVPYVGRQATMVRRAMASATKTVERRLRAMMAKQAQKFAA